MWQGEVHVCIIATVGGRNSAQEIYQKYINNIHTSAIYKNKQNDFAYIKRFKLGEAISGYELFLFVCFVTHFTFVDSAIVGVFALVETFILNTNSLRYVFEKVPSAK